MSKTYCLVIGSDLSIQRSWMDGDMVLSLITARTDVKVYRCSTDQVAILVEEVPGLTSLVWSDVETVEVIK